MKYYNFIPYDYAQTMAASVVRVLLMICNNLFALVEYINKMHH